MSSTLSRRRSEFPVDLDAAEPAVDPILRAVDPRNDGFPIERRSLGKRASRALARFLIMFCIGVAATLAWQSYGGAAREMIASSSPQLGWLAPQAALVAHTAPDMIVPAAPSPDLEQFQAGLAVVLQSVDRLAAGQEQMTRDITKLQAVEQDIFHKISAPPPPPPPAAAPARKPAPLTPPPPSQAAPVR